MKYWALFRRRKDEDGSQVGNVYVPRCVYECNGNHGIMRSNVFGILPRINYANKNPALLFLLPKFSGLFGRFA